MNRRQMLAAASSLALAGCGGDKKDAQKETMKETPKAAAQDFAFKSHLNLSPSSIPRALTPHEIYSEAQVATMLLIALHKTPRESILPNASPTGRLVGVDTAMYGKVREYMTKYPQAVEPVLIAFQSVVQDVTLYAAESADDGGYTGPPEGCLSSGNTDLIAKALATVPKA
jgi:hypothetical protein